MFCPQCATEIEMELAYCPKCGQALADVRLALRGAPAESLEQLKAGAKWMNGGIATLVVFMLIAVFITLIGIVFGHPVMSAIGMLNALVGALIGIPLVVVGKIGMKRATRLLSGSQTESKTLLTEARGELLAVRAEQAVQLSPPASVTEHTTLNLDRANRPNRDSQ
jgi:hypothetical protein